MRSGVKWGRQKRRLAVIQNINPILLAMAELDAVCAVHLRRRAVMSSLKDQIITVKRRIEQLKLQVQQQRAHIEALHREGYAIERERGALDAMIAELALKERYRLSLLQEAAFVGERRNMAS